MKVNVELESVVSPRTELHLAYLDVEWEVPDIDGTGRTEDGGRDPRHFALGAYDRHTVTVFLEPCVRTVQYTCIHNKYESECLQLV